MSSIWDSDDMEEIIDTLIMRIKGNKYRKTAVDNLIRGLVISVVEIKEENKNNAKKFMDELEKDYSDGSEKPDLIPRDNREYWLFTEIWQRCTDFFTKAGNG